MLSSVSQEERGLESYSKSWLKENRRNLGFQRLELETETLQDIFELPNWTNEEVKAWLDWDSQETREVEGLEELECITRGGPSTERDIQGLLGQIDRFA